MIECNSTVTGQQDCSGGFPEESFEKLYALELSSFWFQARNELLLWALRRYFPQMRSFLEIGCGTGYVLGGVGKAFPDADLVGSDLFETALSFARQRTQRAMFVSFDATNIPFEKRFDVVGIFDVLEHINDDSRVLKEIHKALVPGGGLILTVPQHPGLWSAADDYAKHVRRYTSSDLCRKLEDSGFTITRCTSFVSLLLPLMLLFRKLQAVSGKEYVPADEMNTASRLDALLKAIMNVERGLILCGANLPAGGSLLVVCTKQ